jgi:hypothetical protein
MNSPGDGGFYDPLPDADGAAGGSLPRMGSVGGGLQDLDDDEFTDPGDGESRGGESRGGESRGEGKGAGWGGGSIASMPSGFAAGGSVGSGGNGRASVI